MKNFAKYYNKCIKAIKQTYKIKKRSKPYLRSALARKDLAKISGADPARFSLDLGLDLARLRLCAPKDLSRR